MSSFDIIVEGTTSITDRERAASKVLPWSRRWRHVVPRGAVGRPGGADNHGQRPPPPRGWAAARRLTVGAGADKLLATADAARREAGAMVLVGTKDISRLLARRRRRSTASTPRRGRSRASRLLQVLFEIDDRDRESLVPRALHPDDPARRHLHRRALSGQPGRAVPAGAGAGVVPRGGAASRVPAARVRQHRGRGRGARRADGATRAWSGDVRLSRYHDRIVGDGARSTGGRSCACRSSIRSRSTAATCSTSRR